jgi:hypothetical protein
MLQNTSYRNVIRRRAAQVPGSEIIHKSAGGGLPGAPSIPRTLRNGWESSIADNYLSPAHNQRMTKNRSRGPLPSIIFSAPFPVSQSEAVGINRGNNLQKNRHTPSPPPIFILGPIYLQRISVRLSLKIAIKSHKSFKMKVLIRSKTLTLDGMQKAGPYHLAIRTG